MSRKHPTKTCSTCKEVKDLSHYCKNKITKDGFHNICTSCRANYRDKRRDKIRGYNKKYKAENRDKVLEYAKEYKKKNKEKYNANLRKYYHRNKERLNNRNKEYYKNNKEQIFKQQLEYQNKKYNSDPTFKLIVTLRSRIRSILKAKNFIKTNHMADVLGADIDVVRCHIESKFAEWMTWENHGTHTWHIDHIVPLSSANSVEEMYKLCHYTNLQPLPARENIVKSNKIISPPPHHAPE